MKKNMINHPCEPDYKRMYRDLCVAIGWIPEIENANKMFGIPSLHTSPVDLAQKLNQSFNDLSVQNACYEKLFLVIRSNQLSNMHMLNKLLMEIGFDFKQLNSHGFMGVGKYILKRQFKKELIENILKKAREMNDDKTREFYNNMAHELEYWSNEING